MVIKAYLFEEATHCTSGFVSLNSSDLLWVKEQALVKQETEGHSTKRTCFVTLHGGLPPSLIAFPVGKENLKQPPICVCPYNIYCAQVRISTEKIPKIFFPFIP
jgi:hypothetical protein